MSITPGGFTSVTQAQVAIMNLKRLMAVLPMIEDQRNTIIHAINTLAVLDKVDAS